MRRIAGFIVKYRFIILALFLGLCAYCVWGMTKVKIEYSIASYLPSNTDTKKAIDIMDEEFTTYGSTRIMVRNISYDRAEALHLKISELEGVKSFEFGNTEKYYKKSCALFEITFVGNEDDPVSVDAYQRTVEYLDDYDYLVSSSLVDTYADDLAKDVRLVLILAVVVIVVVLAFTSKSLGELPVFLLTFGMAALLNMGTNYWFGTISFISNSVCVILQLALAIDYAIILSHRFAEERAGGRPPKEAMVLALSKAVPEIAGSSLTTISGLLALCTMALRLGQDMGLVLAKSIIMSMVSVFLFMPCLMLLFSKAIDKTTHRSLVPKITAIGRFDVKLRYVLVALFLAVVGVSGYFSFQTEYAYSSLSIDTNKPSAQMIAVSETQKVFGYSNQFVVLVPRGDYALENKVLKTVDAFEEISDALGMSNVEVERNGCTFTLTEPITYKELSVFLATDEETAEKIFLAYAFFSKEEVKDGVEETGTFLANKDIYRASLLQMCDCAFAHNDFIYALLYDDADALDAYLELKDTLEDAERQLVGTNYTRLVFNLNCKAEGKETYALLEAMQKQVKQICPEAIFAGDSMSSYDLNKSFSTDNLLVTLLTLLFVFAVLMFTFRSWGLPIPLTFTIQGSIFINFSFYALFGRNVFFFVYLIVSALQMGATIDYAIVFTNRYQELKQKMDGKHAAVEALNQAFPTILTSGTILAMAGFLVGAVVKDPLISTLGLCLGRGVIVSIISVLFVLPALMSITGKWLDKTFLRRKSNKISLKKKIKSSLIASVSEENHENKD